MRIARFAGLRRIVALLRPHAAEERWPLVSGALMGVSVVLLHLFQPWPLKWILDFLTGRHRPGIPLLRIAHDATAGILAPSILYLVVAAAAAGAAYGQTMLLNGAINRAVYRFRASLFAQVLRQPLAYHEARGVGEMLTRVIYDTSRLRRGVVGLVLHVVQTLFLFGLILVVLLRVNLGLGLIFGLCGVLAALTMTRRSRRIARAAGKQRGKEGELASLMAEDLRAIRELQTFGLSASGVQRRFARRNGGSLRKEQRVRRLSAQLTLSIEALLAVTIALALWVGARAVQSGGLGAGDLVLFFSYAVSLRGPLTEFANQTARFGRTDACAERLHRITRRAPRIADPAGAIRAPELRGEIELEAVSLKIPARVRRERKWALRNVSCRIPAGRRVALVGENGAGKSSLLRLVLRLADAKRGRVLIDGHDLRNCRIDSVRGQMSVVFQDSVPAGLTVRQCIAQGRDDAGLEAIRAAAAAARAAEWIEGLPLGYDTPILRGGDLLSRGERQRLALARALLRDGRIWLLDEPTAGLDWQTAGDLVGQLLEATAGRTTLWVTQDPAVVARLDWVMVLEHGHLVFEGPSVGYQPWHASAPRAAAGGA